MTIFFCQIFTIDDILKAFLETNFQKKKDNITKMFQNGFG